VVFYKKIQETSLRSCRSTIHDLKGLYNINKKIIKCIVDYTEKHKDEKIRVYCCLDRESRYGEVPGLNIGRIKKHIKDTGITSILSVDLIRATQQIESWFLYDIESIYGFLKVPRHERNLKAYNPPERFGYKDLQRLFERHSRSYNKGRDGENFINNLDIEKIARECKELRDGVELIMARASDSTNHIFRGSR
jgi:hypothetical protein